MIQMTKKFVLPLFCTVIASMMSPSARAQGVPPRQMKVRVMQKGTGVVVRKVEVMVGSQKYLTGPEGVAEIDIASDAKEIRFERPGFEALSLAADDFKDTLELEVYLYPKLQGDDEVIVKGKRRPSVSKKVVTVEEAQRVAPGGDPGQVTKLMPGVTSKVGRSDVSIRGSRPEDSKYIIDDIEVPYLYHAIGNLSVIPPSSISDVEFSAGGFGPEFGDATGGIVALKTKTEVPERAVTRYTLNLPIYVSLYYEAPLSEDTGVSVGVRRSYLDKIIPKMLPKNSGVTLIPFFSDYQGVWTHKEENGHTKLTLLASSDGLKATFPGDFSSDESGASDFYLKTYFGVVALERSYRIDNSWTVVSTPQVLYTDNQFNVNDLKFRVRAYDYRIPVEFTKRLSQTEKLYLGLDVGYVPYTVTYYLPRFDQSDPFYDFQEAPRIEGNQTGKYVKMGSWISRDFQVGDALLSPGVRIFHFTQNHRTGIDPRFSGRYTLSSTHTAKMAVGQYSQLPHNGEASPDFGNPKIHFPRAMHYILGLESKWDERWDSDLQVFYKDVRGVIHSDDVLGYNNDGSLQSRGFEVFIRRAMTERWFGWLSYTYSITKERQNDESSWHPGDNDQTHVLSLAGSYKWTATTETGGRLASHTGDVYTSKMGDAVYNANLDKYQPRGDQTVNGARLPHYNELSIYNGHDFLFDTSKMTLRYGLEYLWFKRQALSASTNYDYSTETYSQGLPPIPYLEVRGEF